MNKIDELEREHTLAAYWCHHYAPIDVDRFEWAFDQVYDLLSDYKNVNTEEQLWWLEALSKTFPDGHAGLAFSLGELVSVQNNVIKNNDSRLAKFLVDNSAIYELLPRATDSTEHVEKIVELSSKCEEVTVVNCVLNISSIEYKKLIAFWFYSLFYPDFEDDGFLSIKEEIKSLAQNPNTSEALLNDLNVTRPDEQAQIIIDELFSGPSLRSGSH